MGSARGWGEEVVCKVSEGLKGALPGSSSGGARRPALARPHGERAAAARERAAPPQGGAPTLLPALLCWGSVNGQTK